MKTSDQRFVQVTAVLLIAVIIIGCVMNLVAVALLLSLRRKKSIHEVLILSLSITDILRCVVCGTLEISSLLEQHWMAGTILCPISAFLIQCLMFVVVAHFFALTLVAYLSICHLNQMMPIFARKPAYVMACIIVCWAYGTTFAVLPFCGLGKYSLQGLDVQCGLNTLTSDAGSKTYVTLILLFTMVFPVMAMVILVRKIKRKLNMMTTAATVKYGQYHKDALQYMEQETHQTHIIQLMILCYVVTWLPADLTELVEIYLSYSNGYVEILVAALAYFSTVTTPSIQVFVYRESKRRILNRWRGCLLRPRNSVQTTNHNTTSCNSKPQTHKSTSVSNIEESRTNGERV